VDDLWLLIWKPSDFKRCRGEFTFFWVEASAAGRAELQINKSENDNVIRLGKYSSPPTILSPVTGNFTDSGADRIDVPDHAAAIPEPQSLSVFRSFLVRPAMLSAVQCYSATRYFLFNTSEEFVPTNPSCYLVPRA